MRVVNVAVTQGSKKERQAGAVDRAEAACDYLGFDLLADGARRSREDQRQDTRAGCRRTGAASVAVIAAILAEHQPRRVLFPHDTDWNSTHIGTHHLVIDALSSRPPASRALVVETEFWGAMATPNLMVESSGPTMSRT